MTRLIPAILMVAMLACASKEQPKHDDLYFDLGNFHRSVTTSKDEAARWFDRGLVQSYGFNHEEAVRCFERALEHDMNLAMAHWGIAWALGPNYNNPVMEEAASKRAYEATQKAVALAASASPIERDLILALGARYTWPAPEDRAPLETAYAQAMRKVYKEHPDDPDVAALYAEALMMLRPWQLWAPDGTPAPDTPEIVEVLETGMAKWPDHPALCHYYIHTVEPSPNPEKALPAANRLRHLAPDASHLVHMPSHIDVLVGDYEAVIKTNRKAIEADRKYVAREGAMNFYTLYRLHNLHFLVYGAMFDGQQELALSTARELVTEIPSDLLAAYPDFIEAFVPTPLHVLVRFGRWKDILDEPIPTEDQFFTRSIWHYARAVAQATTGHVAEAEGEYAALVEVAARIPESRLMFNNTCRDISEIAVRMAGGEVAYRRGEFDNAFAQLREAVELDDNLNYDEPWGWMQPARHALGALLLEQGHVEEAEDVFRADLKRHPKNGWALHGLAEALRRRNRADDASELETMLARSWKRSDIKLTASCFCRTGEMASR